jgi:hypothetical protein
MLTLKRAQEIKTVFLNDIEASRTLPGRLVQPFFEFYNTEFSPGRYSQMPCTCSPKEWMRMIEEVTNQVNEVLASAKQDVSNAVMDEPQPEDVKKKESKGCGCK